MAEYIEREALMKNFCGYDLTKCVKYGNKDANQQHDSYSTMMMYEIASEIEDAPAADVAPVRRWIPVTERLPECGKRVLATDGGFVGEFYINKRGQWKRYNVNDYSLLMALDILFWMPLPEPPKEDANAKMQ